MWLRTTATRFFIQYRDQVIDDTTKEPLLKCGIEEPIEVIDENEDENEDEDVRIIRRAFAE